MTSANRDPDEAFRALRRDYRLLAERVERLERRLFAICAGAAIAALVVGPFLPYLIAAQQTADGDSSISLLSAVFALPGAGQGPFEGEAMAVGVLLGIFVLAAVVTLVATLSYIGSNTERTRFIARTAAGILLAGSACAWLLVLMLTRQWEWRVSGFSPAPLLIGVGATLVLIAAAIRPEPD